MGLKDSLRTAQMGVVQVIRRLGTRAYPLFALGFTVLIISDLGVLNLIAAADTKLFDSLISHRLIRPKADPQMVIIDIDEASLAAMAPQVGRWPWPNQVLGELVHGLEQQHPKAIVFDILFSDRDLQRPQSDAAFNAEIAQSHTTFFPMLRLDPANDHLSRIPVSALPGASPVNSGDGQRRDDATIAMVLPKVPAALDNGRLGTHQVTPDRDGVIRRYPAWLEHAGWRIPSLPQRIAQELGYAGAQTQDVLLNWRGPPFTYHYVGFSEVYADLKSAHPQRAPDEFTDKIIIIGSTAPSLFDVKGSPMARIHPGVEILATAIDNFKHGDYLHERPRWVMKLAALLLIWAMAIALYRQTRIEVFDKVFGALQAVLMAVAYVVVNLSDWYLDASAPLSLGLSFFALARIYYGQSRRWMANGMLHDLQSQPSGSRKLIVLALRLEGATAPERKRLQSDLDRGVAQSRCDAARIVDLVGDPGFVNSVFSDVMLVYWLIPQDSALDWQSDVDIIQRVVAQGRQQELLGGRLRIAQQARDITWSRVNGWTEAVFASILDVMRATAPATLPTFEKERTP